MLGLLPTPRPEYAFCGCGGLTTIGMESDRVETVSSGRSGGRLALPDMPPGDPPLQDTALRFRQDCEQLLAKHSLLGVARGEYPPRALAVEENFPTHLLPPLDASTATAKEMTDRMQLEIRNRRNDQLRLTYLMADRTEVFTAIYECARKHHAAFAKDLIAWCDLTASGFEEYRDGPRAWLLILSG